MFEGLTFITHNETAITTIIGSEFFEWHPHPAWSHDKAVDEFQALIRLSTAMHNTEQGWVIEDGTGEVMYHFHGEINLDPGNVGYPTDECYLCYHSG